MSLQEITLKGMMDLQGMAKDISLALAPAMDLQITEANDANKVRELTLKVNQLKKQVEEKRTQLVSPHLQAQRDINDMAKRLMEPVVKAEAHLKNETIRWANIERERIEAEKKKLREEEERKRKEIEVERLKKEQEEREAMEFFGKTETQLQKVEAQVIKEQEKAVAERVVQQETKLAERDLRLQEKAATKGMYEVIEFELVNIQAVPIPFLKLDEVAVREHIKRQVKMYPDVIPDIRGLRLYKVQKIRAT